MLNIINKKIIQKKPFDSIEYEVVNIKNFKFSFRTYGKLNAKKTNVVLVEHPLSYDTNIVKTEWDKDAWWGNIVKANGVIDPQSHFIIIVSTHSLVESFLSCPNQSINFFNISKVKEEVLEYFEISTVFTLIGASFGGAQALAFSCYAKKIVIENIVLISTSHKAYKNQILFRLIVQEVLNLTDRDKQEKMHRLIRLLFLYVYRQPDTFNTCEISNIDMIKSYIYRVTDKLKLINPKVFNCYCNMLNTFNFEKVLLNIKSRVLLIASETDSFYTVSQMKDFYKALSKNSIDVQLKIVSSLKGHDAFLLEQEIFSNVIAEFFALEAA
ncbi:MAG: hypothetical protein A3E87_06185 [Gammaproteobacteria bacterium RIFCSPHIGHO2_12_FULL_35_23]|nr:MAG: hypothetical protein A3E87_06185 [Gammaproteobacteria bacterium RIFCSPHIGHO2_12_FULL_35_23]